MHFKWRGDKKEITNIINGTDSTKIYKIQTSTENALHNHTLLFLCADIQSSSHKKSVLLMNALFLNKKVTSRKCNKIF